MLLHITPCKNNQPVLQLHLGSDIVNQTDSIIVIICDAISYTVATTEHAVTIISRKEDMLAYTVNITYQTVVTIVHTLAL